MSVVHIVRNDEIPCCTGRKSLYFKGTGTVSEIYHSVRGEAMTGVQISRWTRERQRKDNVETQQNARIVMPEGPRWMVGIRTKIRDL